MGKMIGKRIGDVAYRSVKEVYVTDIDRRMIQVEKTNREFEGDYTLVVFPLLKISHKSPQETAAEIGDYLLKHLPDLDDYKIVKGFLNLKLKDKFWLDFFEQNLFVPNFGFFPLGEAGPVIVEYSSPNTNKPLHLGHIRNNLLGYSLSKILEANGQRVIKINLVNDRGIHICKSMLAWMKWGNAETPEKSGMKGDHLVGKYYVMFDKKHREEIEQLVKRGYTEDDAYAQAPIMKEAKSLLKDWENADDEVLTIWHKMNQWAYNGFDETYKKLGVNFDYTNYESKIYLEGRDHVMEGLEKGRFYRQNDGSVWVDLTDEGLDEKLLLRSDGTSLYITQDIGTAVRRYNQFFPQKMIYVVGNEQIYHFEVLKKVIKKLEMDWYDKILHLSYGMVELPEGRMKSREGKVVDADDLIDEMFETARITTDELGKTDDFTVDERDKLYQTIGLGALKYFILKVDPKKNMLFNPGESIDFNGNTGPFIQYTYARIRSIMRKAGKSPETIAEKLNIDHVNLTSEEKELIHLIYEFPEIVKQAGETYSPSTVANFVYELAKTFNQYYQDTPILKRVDPDIGNFRVLLSWFTGNIINSSMDLLGIQVPERM